MKILLINGSPRKEGSTHEVMKDMHSILQGMGFDTEELWVGKDPVQDCTACNVCRKLKNNRCAMAPDMVNEWLEKAAVADGILVGTPVHFSAPSGSLLSILDRMFYAGLHLMRGKPAATFAVVRRGGSSLALQVLNQYFLYNEMPLASGSYWAMVHGAVPQDVHEDLEGMQTVRNMCRNLGYLVQALAAAKAAGVEEPTNEYGARTNFVR